MGRLLQKERGRKVYEVTPKIELPTAMEAFLRHHQRTGGRRNDYTILRRHLYLFNLFLDGASFFSLNHGKAQSFVTWLGENYSGYSSGYRANILKSIKRFYRYQSEEGIISHDPFSYVQGPKVNRILPRDIPLDKEVRSILREIPMTCMRDRAIVEVLYGSGIRISELIELTLKSVNESEGWLHIKDAKTKTERNVPLSSQALFAISAYRLGEREALLSADPSYRKGKEDREPDEERLFIKSGAYPLSAWDITVLLDGYAKKAGITKKITAHSFRHACAREMLKGGASIRYVQRMLGHDNITTTMIYTRLSAREVQQALEAFHPRGEKKK